MTDSTRTLLPMATNGCSCCAPATHAPAPTERQSADPTGTNAGGTSPVTVTGPASADAVQGAIEAAGYRVRF